MKKALSLLLLASFLTQAHASCLGGYYYEDFHEEEEAYDNGCDAAFVGAVVGVAATSAIAPAVALGGASMLGAYLISKKREYKYLGNLIVDSRSVVEGQESSKRLEKLSEKMSKRLNRSVSSDELSHVINQLDNDDKFCVKAAASNPGYTHYEVLEKEDFLNLVEKNLK